MAEEVARDSLSAWRSLCEKGGLELEDRDADFTAQLIMALAPGVSTLDEALRISTTDQLVRALLDTIHPFADMFRAVLEFFKLAGARQGRDHWRIAIEDEHLGLKDFQEFLESWSRIDAELDIPAVDLDGLRTVFDEVPYENPLRHHLMAFISDPDWQRVGIADIDTWIEGYQRGAYLPFPTSLQPGRVPAGLVDTAGIAWAANEVAHTLGGSRDRIDAYRSRRGFYERMDETRHDGLSAPVIAQVESDFWLGAVVMLLGRALRLPPAEQAELGQRLAEAYARFPRRKVGFRADTSELESILSLPVWKKRHELYAVWIATEMVSALHGHDYELHHENGAITFAFRETVLATIRSAIPDKRIIAEKRVPVDQPIGKGRTGNVQPDYGVWAGTPDDESCGLIVEVKHYKKAARTRFREVLVDYARAHPEGTILLVNHGPVGDMVDGIDEAIRRRCDMFGDLTPRNVGQRDAFKALVRKHVGEPICSPEIESAGAGTAVLIDVSGSMASAIAGAGFAGLVGKVTANGVDIVALADNEIRQRCLAADAVAASRSISGHSTELIGPARILLNEYEGVVVITDSDGAADLSALGERLLSRSSTGVDGLWLARLRR